MRSRKHEIKVRLNDAEFDWLNEMVERSIFSREEFIRMMLAGYTLQEAPKEYIKFRYEILHKLDEIEGHVRNRPIKDETLVEIKRIRSELGKTLNEIGEAYIPYYKQRRIQ